MLRYVYSTLISNTQKLERTQVSFNIGMDTDNVVYLHNKYYSAIKNNEFMKFIGKWMELDNIILNEVTQSPKKKKKKQKKQKKPKNKKDPHTHDMYSLDDHLVPGSFCWDCKLVQPLWK